MARNKFQSFRAKSERNRLIKRIYKIELKQDASISEIYYDNLKKYAKRMRSIRKGPLINFMERYIIVDRPGVIPKY